MKSVKPKNDGHTYDAPIPKKQKPEECPICDKENGHRGPCVLITAYKKHEKQAVKGELYDTQGIEGLRRVSDSKKQNVEEWLELCRIGGNGNRDSDGEYVIITDARDALVMARVEEREKVLAEQGDYYDLREVEEREAHKKDCLHERARDQAYADGYLVGEQETAKKIFEELELRFGPVFEKEKKR